MSDIRPYRSILFCPGSNPRAMEKALMLPADVVVFDLEDAVAPDAKNSARDAVAAMLSPSPTQLRAVRINSLESDWGNADLLAVAGKADAVVLPKVESAKQVEAVTRALLASDADHVPLWCMIETPKGVLAARKIAKAAGVEALIAGANDLSAALRTQGRDALRLSLQTIVLAARAYGRLAFDSVYNDYRDAGGFAEECAQGRAFGFDGKTLIHPSQIDAANAAFSPGEADVAAAQKLIAEYEASAKGAVGVDGKMVEQLHIEDAKRTIALYNSIRR